MPCSLICKQVTSCSVNVVQTGKIELLRCDSPKTYYIAV